MAEGDHGIYHRARCVLFRKTHERFGGLSNMASGYPLVVNGVSIRSSEALYQACRYPHLPGVQRQIIAENNPWMAKMKGKPHRDQSRPDWEEVKVRVMRWCLRVKLAQNWSSFSKLLVETEDLPIVEDSSRDGFWGAVPQDEETLVGENRLGRLLTELRADLQKPNADALGSVEPVPIRDFLLYGEPIQAVHAWRPSTGPLADPDLSTPVTAAWRPRESLSEVARDEPGTMEGFPLPR